MIFTAGEAAAVSKRAVFPFSLVVTRLSERALCSRAGLFAGSCLQYFFLFIHFLVSYICKMATSCGSRDFFGQLFVRNFELGQIFCELDENKMS